MSVNSRKDVKLSLKVMVNKEKNKVVYAVADNHFTDILLSFLTLPLGRVVKALEKHYGDEAPSIGSLSTLYRSIASLDTAHFVTEGAMNILLDPTSSFEDEYRRLRLDVSDYQPNKYFYCSNCSRYDKIRMVSVYYDNMNNCPCWRKVGMRKENDGKWPRAPSGDGVLTIHKSSFTISDDLKIFPNEMGFVRIVATLGITEDACKAEEIQVSFGLDEMMKLLKASLTSPTPLSDVILNKTTQIKCSPFVEPQPKIEKEGNPELKRLSLKVIIQKSSGKLLYAEAKEDFIEFLFGLLFIPVGETVHLLGGKSCSKAMNNLHRTTSELIDAYFESPGTKNRLMNPNLPHGCISEKYILPLTEECLPANYTTGIGAFSSVKFPKGKGTYLVGPRTYMVTDYLTIAPFCAVSILSTLNKLEIPVSDVEEVELQIGLKDGLSILKASLASTSALTDALLSKISSKRVKREV